MKAEILFVKQNFAAIILGGTGQVGGAAVAELLAIPECREVVMVTRKPIAPRARVRNVVLDTGAADFVERTAALAREVLSRGPASAVSCVGVGSGSMRWSEEELKRLEVGVVGAFARGCHDAGIAQFCLLSAEIEEVLGGKGGSCGEIGPHRMDADDGFRGMGAGDPGSAFHRQPHGIGMAAVPEGGDEIVLLHMVGEVLGRYHERLASGQARQRPGFP